MSTSLGIFFGLLAFFGFGISNAMAKHPIKAIGSELTIFFRNLGTASLIFLSLFFFQNNLIFNKQGMLLAFLFGFLGYIPLYLFYKALKVGKVGILSPIGNSYAVITVILSIIFFKESPTPLQFAAMLTILLGIILISVNLKNISSSDIFSLKSGIPLALAAAFLWGLFFFGVKYPITLAGPMLAAFFIESGVVLGAALNLIKTKTKLFLPKRSTLLQLLGIAILGAIAIVSFNVGITLAPVSIIVAINAANPLVAALYGRIFFKEKLSTKQILAIFLIVLGVLVLSVF